MKEPSLDRNQKTRAYLSFLLDHEDSCLNENCPLCQTAHSIYDLVRARSLARQAPFNLGEESTTVH